MASIQDMIITGSLGIGIIENTSSVGNIWLDTTDNKIKYSALSGSDIIIKEAGAPPPPSYSTGLTSALISVPAQNLSTWTQRTADISSYVGATANLVIRYQAGSSFTGDVQFDDFNIGGNTYDPENGTESFETNATSNPSATYSSVSFTALATGGTSGKFNRDASGTPSSGTGNTTGNTGSWYFYAETSGTAFYYFWLKSPSVTISNGTLSLYSAQNGATCGPFEVYLDITA